ncbi:hypothetical protein [Saccharothrix obliqua]|uniref:hypothetical protein n=1 Tax=Saccharothrix obliqua TaxID=2861747 RepID=UPI001C5FD364|nr:hypothetical protein [Saccharothrix obliqua]MBW4720100.1 hypothetical protein [Saccharothrix obliqua]
MLYLVALLVLAAVGLLVPALTTAQNSWAWGSAGASAAAALVLFWDWALRRRRSAGVDHQISAGDHPNGTRGVAVSPDRTGEPAEEDTDAVDLLAVADLPDEVRVLDERPRYHLTGCTWLADRPSLALPVGEARQLGFTPCAACRPDSTLAARHRA